MSGIQVVNNPSEEMLEAMGVFEWPVWEHGPGTFPWTYNEEEVCYLLDGEAVVTPDGGAPVSFGVGDLVTFPAGISCIWDISQAVRKRYAFP